MSRALLNVGNWRFNISLIDLRCYYQPIFILAFRVPRSLSDCPQFNRYPLLDQETLSHLRLSGSPCGRWKPMCQPPLDNLPNIPNDLVFRSLGTSSSCPESNHICMSIVILTKDISSSLGRLDLLLVTGPSRFTWLTRISLL